MMCGLGEIWGDALGKINEYFLGKLALVEGQKGAVFHQPISIFILCVEIIGPFYGKILDLSCGHVHLKCPSVGRRRN